VAVSDAQIDFDFWHPFVGYLPGCLAINEAAGPDQPSWDEYVDLPRRQWHAPLDSPISKVEQLLHQFLERHPSASGVGQRRWTSGHLPFPMAPHGFWVGTDRRVRRPSAFQAQFAGRGLSLAVA
jgi:hypothetical protein